MALSQLSGTQRQLWKWQEELPRADSSFLISGSLLCDVLSGSVVRGGIRIPGVCSILGAISGELLVLTTGYYEHLILYIG